MEVIKHIYTEKLREAFEAFKKTGIRMPDGTICFCPHGIGHPLIQQHLPTCTKLNELFRQIDELEININYEGTPQDGDT